MCFKQYNIFKRKHYYVSEQYNNKHYYNKLYNNNLPKIITCLQNEINSSDFNFVLNPNRVSEYIGISKTPLLIKICITRNMNWISDAYYVKIIFVKYNHKLYPVHLIDIE